MRKKHPSTKEAILDRSGRGTGKSRSKNVFIPDAGLHFTCIFRRAMRAETTDRDRLNTGRERQRASPANPRRPAFCLHFTRAIRLPRFPPMTASCLAERRPGSVGLHSACKSAAAVHAQRQRSQQILDAIAGLGRR
jgi:hypothetical protein